MSKLTKEKLKEYLKNRFDVTLEQIFISLELTAKDLPKLEVYLEELIEEKWIVRTMTGSGIYEYDLGEELNYGGIRG